MSVSKKDLTLAADQGNFHHLHFKNFLSFFFSFSIFSFQKRQIEKGKIKG